MSGASATSPEATAVAAEELRDAVSLLVRRLRQSRATGDLTPPESAALADLVRHAPLTGSDLARAQGISPQSIAPTISALEAKGLVARRPDPADGRRVLLDPTPAGAEQAAHRRDARTEQLSHILAADFTAEERERLRAATPLLARLADALVERRIEP